MCVCVCFAFDGGVPNAGLAQGGVKPPCLVNFLRASLSISCRRGRGIGESRGDGCEGVM